MQAGPQRQRKCPQPPSSTGKEAQLGEAEGVAGPPAPGTDQSTALRPGPAHPKPALGSPLFLEVLPAKARATGQEGSPEGGAWCSDMTSLYKQLGTNSGPHQKR